MISPNFMFNSILLIGVLASAMPQNLDNPKEPNDVNSRSHHGKKQKIKNWKTVEVCKRNGIYRKQLLF